MMIFVWIALLLQCVQSYYLPGAYQVDYAKDDKLVGESPNF